MYLFAVVGGTVVGESVPVTTGSQHASAHESAVLVTMLGSTCRRCVRSRAMRAVHHGLRVYIRRALGACVAACLSYLRRYWIVQVCLILPSGLEVAIFEGVYMV